MSEQQPDPTSLFARLVWGRDDALHLDEACLLVSAHARPGLDVGTALGTLDRLAEGIDSFAAWHARLFTESGFAGDAEDYHAAENSLLDRVLARRRGMPITLAVVGIEVARRAGVPMAGIGMPGHFLLRHTGEPAWFVDPFAGGELLDAAGCEALFRKIADPGVPFRPDYLAPVTNRQIVGRILANLRNTYATAGDGANLAWVLRLQLLLPDPALTERSRFN
ncbi:MAG TPA: transglutaminase-like domain-containing protein [Acidimicrobiales bacterium]|nr:transglutaminase-like domain-containing protein [Acidimicrobiales bacterium]